jgi:ubiquinone/menaquinone biosynthesis C-methylase UbiE
MSNNKAEAKRYDRVAWRYDFLESPMEMMAFSKLRSQMLAGVRGKVLDVGTGTGKNLPYYPAGVELVGIDISPKMLAKAKTRAEKLGLDVDLQVMDVENLQFPDSTFDFIVVTFVFCSVSDPIKGLRELARVVRDDGTILLLEHVRSENRVLGKIMDWLNPEARALFGPNINRRTVENIKRAGLEVVSVESKGPKILKKIVARRPIIVGSSNTPAPTGDQPPMR